MDRGKRLSSRALTFALLCGSVFGVTGASGHGDTAAHPHFARPVAIRMSARVPGTDPTALGTPTRTAVTVTAPPTATTTTTASTSGTTPTPTTSTPATTATTPETTTTATAPATTDTQSSGSSSGDQSQGTTTTPSTASTGTDTTGTDTTGTDSTGTDTTTDTTGTDTTGTDTTGTGTTCAPAPGSPGFVPAGHATGDPWKNCTQIGPGGSGQTGGGSGQAGGGTTPPVTVPTTPVTVTTTPTTTPTLPTTPSSPTPTGTGPSTSGTTPGGTKTTGQSSNPFFTGGPWTKVAKTAKRNTARTLFDNSNGLLGLESGLGVNGTLVGLRSDAISGAGGVGLTGSASSPGAGAGGKGSASGKGEAGQARRRGSDSGGSGFTTFIDHQFIRVIPGSVWLALAGAFGLTIMATGAAVFFGRRSRRQANRIAEVSAAALTDPLTGVLNRRGFTEAVERELARSRRYARPFVIAYVDVRGLKGVNDSEGHLAGDELLKAAARTLSGSARAHDVIGRLGGDEFGVLLAEQSAEDAQGVVARIRERVRATRTELGFGAFWDLTIGIAAYAEDGDSFEELIAAADRRLYEQRGIELSAAR